MLRRCALSQCDVDVLCVNKVIDPHVQAHVLVCIHNMTTNRIARNGLKEHLNTVFHPRTISLCLEVRDKLILQSRAV